MKDVKDILQSVAGGIGSNMVLLLEKESVLHQPALYQKVTITSSEFDPKRNELSVKFSDSTGGVFYPATEEDEIEFSPGVEVVKMIQKMIVHSFGDHLIGMARVVGPDLYGPALVQGELKKYWKRPSVGEVANL